ncbi:unnamed protein product, partial [Polarella glacialis]
VWHDDVNLNKKPVWSMTAPDRKMLDQMLGTWTPASSSCQPRAPDPGEYGDVSNCGHHGLFGAPKWSYARSSGRACLAPDPPQRIETEITLPSSFCGKDVRQHKAAHWSIYGKDRSKLGSGDKSWTPKPNNDVRPGPGTYDVARTPKWK